MPSFPSCSVQRGTDWVLAKSTEGLVGFLQLSQSDCIVTFKVPLRTVCLPEKVSDGQFEEQNEHRLMASLYKLTVLY